MTRNLNSTMGDTAMNTDYWSIYSLIEQPAGMGTRRRNWPLYLGLALIVAALAYLIVHGAN